MEEIVEELPAGIIRSTTAMCTPCSAQGLQCDYSSVCKHCSLSHKPYKPIMCKYFETNLCLTKVCRFAHEGDGFKKLVSLTLMICSKKNNSEVTSTTKRRWSTVPNNATKENSVQS